ncbi:hypothetical protein [Dyella nitratireducens]|uniref:hypothetical protein n=1 Tax=Dyella nitratireducens TaxID=1849580 RepID=UPI00166360AA|nr:hypothetical protein [Dyella nitratireducens]
MKGLFARNVSQGTSLISLLACFMGFSLGLTLAACQSSDRSSQIHTEPSPGGQVAAANVPCEPGWADRRGVPIKITDSLIVSVPMKYIQYEMLTCGARTNGIPRAAPLGSTSIGFDFFLPDFGGFTSQTLRELYPINEVHVFYVASAASQGFHPSNAAGIETNQFKGSLPILANTNKYEDLYGLRCYPDKSGTRMLCYNAQAGNNHSAILLSVDIPGRVSGIVNPSMRATYFASRYGGIQIDWITSVRNLPRWREIDEQIWSFLAAWNMANPAKSATSR